jgi:PHP family Zn ribbon phosphoesterase
VLPPKESIKHNNICPVCGRPLTIGVAHRVSELADREEGYKPEGAVPFKNLIPLSELIAGVIKKAVATAKVWEVYNKLIENFDNEINILLKVPKDKLSKVTTPEVADIITKNRDQKIKVLPGYDGVYGKPVFSDEDIVEYAPVKLPKEKQTGLSDF